MVLRTTSEPSECAIGGRTFRAKPGPVPPATARSLRLPLNVTYAQAVALAIVQEATRGNVAAFKEIADRLHGHSVQSVQFDGEMRTTLDVRSDALVVEKLLGASADASDASALLYAQLVAFIRTSRDEKSMEVATTLALPLKESGSDVPNP